MHTPAKGASLEIGFEGSNPSLHAKCSHSIVDSTAVYETAELSSSLSGNTNVSYNTFYTIVNEGFIAMVNGSNSTSK